MLGLVKLLIRIKGGGRDDMPEALLLDLLINFIAVLLKARGFSTEFTVDIFMEELCYLVCVNKPLLLNLAGLVLKQSPGP